MTRYASELDDFSELLRSAAKWKGVPAAIFEKDYFLTRALCALASAHSGQFILKGGTSLSKGWQLLQRFSEDLDILVRSEPGWGKGLRDNCLKGLAETIRKTNGFAAQPVREAEAGVHRTVVFTYPSVENDLQGLSRTIKLEMGYRGNAAAATKLPIRSMLEEFAAANGYAGLAEDLNLFEIELQDLCRTFVEKLFAAFDAYESNHARGKARHYYDLYELCRRSEVQNFAGTDEYRRVFVEVKGFVRETFDARVPEGDSFSACPAFQPVGKDRDLLEENYKRESDLFFGRQPPLAEVLYAIGAVLPKL